MAICLSSHSMLTFAVHIFFGKFKFQPDFIVYTAYKMWGFDKWTRVLALDTVTCRWYSADRILLRYTWLRSSDRPTAYLESDNRHVLIPSLTDWNQRKTLKTKMKYTFFNREMVPPPPQWLKVSEKIVSIWIMINIFTYLVSFFLDLYVYFLYSNVKKKPQTF